MNEEKSILRLNTVVEKALHKLLFQIRENMYDYVHLYIRRNKKDLDHNQVEEVLKIVKLALEEGELTKLPEFIGTISKEVSEFTQLENPLGSTEQQTQETGKKPSNKVTFHI